jgi:hypothetical protein
MDLECQEQLIEYKIHEINLLINDFVNKLKIKNRKEKRKIYNKNYYINKSTKHFKLFIL